MRSRRALLIGVGGLAVLLLALFLLHQNAPVADIVAVRQIPRPATVAARRAQQVAGWMTDSLGRPLFNRHRRPAAPPPPAALAAAPPQAPPPRLTGVLVGPFGSSAVFVQGGSDKSVTVQEGGQVGSYHIRHISPNEVLVDGPDGPRVLHPAFGGGGAAVPARSAAEATPEHLASRQ